MLQPQAGKGEAKEGFKTKRKRVVHKDKVSLKRWEGAVGSPEASCTSHAPPPSLSQHHTDYVGLHFLTSSARQLNDELRFHFSEMTEKFLFPLNRYFETLIPTNLFVAFHMLCEFRPDHLSWLSSTLQESRCTKHSSASQAVLALLFPRLAQGTRTPHDLPLQPPLGRSVRSSSSADVLRGLHEEQELWRLVGLDV